jgi:PilZ domain
MPSEQRRQQRFRLVHQPAGPLYVIAAGKRHRATSINDVSSAGLSVCLDDALPVLTNVAIELESAGVTLDVNGVVVWCRAHRASDEAGSEHGHVLGIELFSPMMLLSALRDALPGDVNAFEEVP